MRFSRQVPRYINICRLYIIYLQLQTSTIQKCEKVKNVSKRLSTGIQERRDELQGDYNLR